MTKTTKRTKRSTAVGAAPTPPNVNLMPAGFVGEIQAAKLLGTTPGQLRNYRYRWNHRLPGERGPLFFEGDTGTGGAKRIAYRIRDLKAWRIRKSKPTWVPKGDAPKARA